MGQKNSRQLKNKPEEFFHKKEKKKHRESRQEIQHLINGSYKKRGSGEEIIKEITQRNIVF